MKKLLFVNQLTSSLILDKDVFEETVKMRNRVSLPQTGNEAFDTITFIGHGRLLIAMAI